MVKDMTEGKPGRLILEFAIPLLMGNLFQQFYSLVDTAIVGKFLGVDQLAAVGSTGSINFVWESAAVLRFRLRRGLEQRMRAECAAV
jgi:Na+-driven multidrug efflux pump